MRRRFFGLGGALIFLFCMLILSSTAHASSAGPIIAQVQTGGSTKPTQEFIVIHNNASANVDISGWCVVYNPYSDTYKPALGCFGPLVLASNGEAVLASTDFKAAHLEATVVLTFNAGMSNSGGHVRLFNGAGASKLEIDKVGWGNAASPETLATAPQLSEEPLMRKINNDSSLKDTDNNKLDFIDVCSNIDGNQNYLPDGYVINNSDICVKPICPNLKDSLGNYLNYLPDGYKFDNGGVNCFLDACQNTPELDLVIPPGYESPDGINCSLIPPLPLENAGLVITELLPNAVSTDDGKEFIELYNSSGRPVNLKGYKLELDSGDNYVFLDQTILPGAYVSFSDTQTKITLPNTAAGLKLTAPAGNVVSTTQAYDSPTDGMAWASINGAWQYTNQPTPGSANLASLVQVEEDDGGSGVIALAACPAGKFRNPETNRCKSIESSSSELTPCAPDQVRNPETNRCRSIFSTTGSLAPCQPGQTRNPETNRCRGSTTTASASLTPCGVGQERNPATNRCRKIGASASTLKPCPANQERNPQTNRCRKKSITGLGSSVKDIESGQGSSRNGWLIAGGTLTALAGYGAWEWRSEMANGFRRARQLFSKSPIS